MKATYFLILLVFVVIIFTAGCVNGNQKTIVTLTPTPISTVIPTETSIIQTIGRTEQLQGYKTANEVFDLNTLPAFGFKIDYPESWTMARIYDGKPLSKTNWILSASSTGSSCNYNDFFGGKTAYNYFSSADNKSHTFVFFSDMSQSGGHSCPIESWANNMKKSMMTPYCLDGAGNPIYGDYCSMNQRMYQPLIISNEPVIIPGSFEARKLVFSSYNDKNYGQNTLYLIHSGQMKRYNYTIQNRIDGAVQVDGPAWDFGIGGQSYIIGFHSSQEQVNTTTNIFDRMMKSFEITKKL